MAKFHAKGVLVSGIIALIFLTYFAMVSEDSGSQGRRRQHIPYDRRFVDLPELSNIKREKPPPDVIHVEHPLNNFVREQLKENEAQDSMQGAADNVGLGPSHNGIQEIPSANDSAMSSGFLKPMPRIDGVNIVSMTLYGNQRRYTMGALRNAELIKVNFPGWTLRVYTESPVDAHHGALPKDVVQTLKALGADIYFMQPGEDFIPPMMWRFLIADDTWVDRFIVRDADARLTARDAAAVYAWVQSDAAFTCVRDHPSHAQYAVSGGLWGGKPTALRNTLRRSWRDMMRGVQSQYLEDMNFMNYIIWPKVQNHTFCLDSVSCEQWPGAHPFPVARVGFEHVGQVVSEQDLGRPGDMQILKNTGENKNCTPPALKRQPVSS